MQIKSGLTRNVLSALLLAALLLLSACGETEIVKTDDSGKDDPTRRELQLSFLNKLTLNGKGTNTRAAIATSDEQRIDMLDVYVFGSLTADGEYTFQEKFSYRSDGSSVAGATALEVTNGDGTSAKPTVLLRPKKGLYIKMFCIANQAELATLDVVADPANPKYVPYTHFVPLIQTNPGSADNTVTMGIPTEADFCKLLSRVIDPANKADSIVPALPMVGSCIAPIDLHSFDLASRLSAGMRLVRTVARFDVLNDAATSRFTLESVSMGNGRPVTQLYPLQEQKTADGKLITYPARDLARMPQVNNNKQLPVLYAYGSPVEDEAYLILKGKYRMNATEVQEVSYNVPFSRVVNGTGSRVAITPNHRYTIAITKADPQHVDFDFTVADWENGEDLGSYTPDNAFGTISVEPAAQYDVNSKTMKTSLAPGSEFTVAVGNNMTPEVSLSYDEEGNEWLEATVTTAPATRAEWGQTTTCRVKVKTGNFTAYPAATLKLTNPVDGSYSEMRIAGQVELGGVTIKASNVNNAKYNTTTQTLRFTGLNQEQVASVKVFAPGALTISKPDWLTVEGAPDTGYTITYSGSVTEYTTTPAVVTFANSADVTQMVTLNVDLWPAGIPVTFKNSSGQTKTVTFASSNIYYNNATKTWGLGAEQCDYGYVENNVTPGTNDMKLVNGTISYYFMYGDPISCGTRTTGYYTGTGDVPIANDPCSKLPGGKWRSPSRDVFWMMGYQENNYYNGVERKKDATDYYAVDENGNRLISIGNPYLSVYTPTDERSNKGAVRGMWVGLSQSAASTAGSTNVYNKSKLFLSRAGSRSPNGSPVENVGNFSDCWSFQPYDNVNGQNFGFYDAGYRLYRYSRAAGLLVRCMLL